jgi:hypothetical protein
MLCGCYLVHTAGFKGFPYSGSQPGGLKACLEAPDRIVCFEGCAKMGE